MLLIVAVLGVNQLKDLILYSREYGMEPLVEVHTDLEMEIALSCGAKVIGVNNRNLHTFQLDTQTTERIVNVARRLGYTHEIPSTRGEGGSDAPRSDSPTVLIAALSGITSSEDVRHFASLGVSCCLVGESVMKASDPEALVRSFITQPGHEQTDQGSAGQRLDAILGHEIASDPPLVKLCGLTREEDAVCALQNGVSLLGLIFSHSPRSATLTQAQAIVSTVRRYGERSLALSVTPTEEEEALARTVSGAATEAAGEEGLGEEEKVWYWKHILALKRICVRRPLVVGVFQNQDVDQVRPEGPMVICCPHACAVCPVDQQYHWRCVWSVSSLSPVL